MHWLSFALLVSLVVIIVVKVPKLRSRTYQERPRACALGGAIAGLSPLVGMINRYYFTGWAHNVGLAIQGAMIGLALVLIWKGRCEIRLTQG